MTTNGKHENAEFGCSLSEFFLSLKNPQIVSNVMSVDSGENTDTPGKQ
jgi:hypothetical protein